MFNRLLSYIIILTLSMSILSGCESKNEKADLILTNGYVYTVDNEKTTAQAIAIKDKKILFVGDNKSCEKYVGEGTKTIDLKGKMVLPGFFDSKMAPARDAISLSKEVFLTDVYSKDAYLEKIKEYDMANTDSAIIIGRGYLRSKFDNVGPIKEWLDAIDSKKPIIIISNDSQSMWVNSKVLEMAGITKDTQNPQGGIIQRDPATDEPTGLLLGSAMNLASQIKIEYSKEQYKEALLSLQKELNSQGVTSAFDYDVPVDNPNYYLAYKELAQDGLLTVRYSGAWSLYPELGEKVNVIIDDSISRSESFKTPYFQINAFHFYADQSIAEQTGYLLQPYSNAKDDWSGIKVWPDDTMKSAFQKIDAAGYQIYVDQSGDAAVKYTLDALESVRKINGDHDSRHTLMNVQLISPEDVKRMAAMGMNAIVSPYKMQVDDTYWNLYAKSLGQRANNMFPYRSLIDSGMNVAMSVDSVTNTDYMRAFYSSIKRTISRNAFKEQYKNVPIASRTTKYSIPLRYYLMGPLPKQDETVTIEQAIESATINGAKAIFEEKNLGSIQVSKYADLVIYDKNLLKLNPEDLQKQKPTMTLFDGKIVYDADKK